MESIVNQRCGWCGENPLYVRYHDEEWGRQVTDDRQLFEFLVLEGAQAGLSWLTILRRREAYRKAFLNFDFERVAAMTETDVERLMNCQGIIRNRRKIASVITNARHFIEIRQEFGSFYNYILSFFDRATPVINHPERLGDIPTTSPESDSIAKDMHRRGFRFFGTTICYAFLQATGFVDDHLNSCRCKSRPQS